MNLKILSWNVRGLSERDKGLQIWNLIRSWRAYIICLQEIELECIIRGLVRSLWGCQYVDWLYLGLGGCFRWNFDHMGQMSSRKNGESSGGFSSILLI